MTTTSTSFASILSKPIKQYVADAYTGHGLDEDGNPIKFPESYLPLFVGDTKTHAEADS